MSGRGRDGSLAATPSEAGVASRGSAAAGATAGELTGPAEGKMQLLPVRPGVDGGGLGPTGSVVRPLGAASVVQGWPPLVRRFGQRVQRSGRSAAWYVEARQRRRSGRAEVPGHAS
jgi:hypothetical protein